jgi:hypothetical protein
MASHLEREIALLVFGLRMRRMSSKERAVYFNGLVGNRVAYSLESRVADLIEELKLW